MSNSDEENTEEEQEEIIIPGPMADDLASDGYRRTNSGCPEKECEGLMWSSQNMLVCDTCSYSVDLEARRTSTRHDSPWERYRENPPRYHNSNKVRMPGGFPSAYEWVSSDDVDDVISNINPSDFYR